MLVGGADMLLLLGPSSFIFDIESGATVGGVLAQLADYYGIMSTFPFCVNLFLALRVMVDLSNPMMVLLRYVDYRARCPTAPFPPPVSNRHAVGLPTGIWRTNVR